MKKHYFTLIFLLYNSSTVTMNNRATFSLFSTVELRQTKKSSTWVISPIVEVMKTKNDNKIKTTIQALIADDEENEEKISFLMKVCEEVPLWENGPHIDVIKCLLPHYTNLNAQDCDGNTALHRLPVLHSTLNSTTSRKVADILFQAGADPAIKNKDKKPAVLFTHACAADMTNIVAYLLKQDSSLLLSNSFDDFWSSDDWTGLHWAAWQGSLATIKFLIDNGADIRRRTDWHYTALDLARMNEQKEAVLLLKPYY